MFIYCFWTQIWLLWHTYIVLIYNIYIVNVNVFICWFLILQFHTPLIHHLMGPIVNLWIKGTLWWNLIIYLFEDTLDTTIFSFQKLLSSFVYSWSSWSNYWVSIKTFKTILGYQLTWQIIDLGRMRWIKLIWISQELFLFIVLFQLLDFLMFLL